MHKYMHYNKLWEELKRQCLRLEDLSDLPLIDENTLENIQHSKNINAEDLRIIGDFLQVDPFLLYEISEATDPLEYHWKYAYDILKKPWIEMKVTEDKKTVFFFKGLEEKPICIVNTVLDADFSKEDIMLATGNNPNRPCFIENAHRSISAWYFRDPKICGDEIYRLYGHPWKTE